LQNENENFQDQLDSLEEQLATERRNKEDAEQENVRQKQVRSISLHVYENER